VTEPLEASVDIAASPPQVWRVVSDLSRMGEWSPECIGMWSLSRPRRGGWIVGLNRRRMVVWPTTARFTRYEPEQALAWRMTESGAEWTYELTPGPLGTRLTERRTLPPTGMRWVGRRFARLALGGADSHDAELLAGMRTTLSRIKAAAEAAVPTKP